ncbi:hypothetical protein Pyn_09458 [Prunus yedoensis var. nudiflora]|uniref:Uncharacterized protein n=1 Tax=Prunus yedoensis var. nudiflora TaxID=2094558 RepID=A0A314UDF8_PRUYE|nr:hypothetical protein Pyn_09458 [Prunus yedoensis var. nudiflora]
MASSTRVYEFALSIHVFGPNNSAMRDAFALPINTFDISERTGTLAILILQVTRGTRVYAFAFPINTHSDSFRRTPNSCTDMPVYAFALPINTCDSSLKTYEPDYSVTWHVHKWLTQRAKLEVHGNDLKSLLLLHLVTSLANLAPDENKGAPAKITRVSF